MIPSILPSEFSLSIHFVVLPFSIVFPAISPNVDSLAMNVIVQELPMIQAPIRPIESAIPMLHSLRVTALIG